MSRGMLGLIGLWFLVRAIWGRGYQHHEGLMVGVIAGLIPCPLTLFAVFLALARGVPEAGLTFTLSMSLEVSLTLAVVAGLVVLTRTWFVTTVANLEASFGRLSRVLEGLTGQCSLPLALRSFGRRWS